MKFLRTTALLFQGQGIFIAVPALTRLPRNVLVNLLLAIIREVDCYSGTWRHTTRPRVHGNVGRWPKTLIPVNGLEQFTRAPRSDGECGENSTGRIL